MKRFFKYRKNVPAYVELDYYDKAGIVVDVVAIESIVVIVSNQETPT